MSHTVMRGAPTKAQLYLDSILDELVAETGRQEDRYCLAKILFKCLRDNPNDIRQIEGESGAVDTNRIVLERSVRTALALQHAGMQPGDTVLVITRNNLEFSGVFFGALFAGIITYFLHVGINAYELKHFVNIKKPNIIFIEKESLLEVKKCLGDNDLNIPVILFGQTDTSDHQTFSEFITGFDDCASNFRLVDTDRDTPVMILSTSGSTGLPKTAVLRNRGLVAQLPVYWYYSERLPRPTAIYLCISGPNWITYSIAVCGALAFGVTVLFTNATLTTEHLRMLLRKYKPTMSMISGHLGATLTTEPGHQPGDLSSLDTLYMGGGAIHEHILLECQKRVHRGGRACNAFGITEMHGGVGIPKPGAPITCLGTILNWLDFKIVDDEGNKLGPHQQGELLLKSNECTFKEYVNNEEAYKETFTEDGWFKTGDKVYMDEQEQLYYVDRIKFLIKYQNNHVSPSEVEEVITRLEGVHSAAVCEAERGPAAVVVPRSGYTLTPQHIHDAVSSTLSDFKRLRGGVVFVSSIPLSVNGKIERKKVKEMFKQYSEDQKHYEL